VATSTGSISQQLTRAGTTHGGTYGLSVTESVNIPAALRAYKRADYVLAQAELTYQAAQQDLIVRAATRYFSVLAARDSLLSAETSLDAYNRTLEQQEKRFEVGLAAITDVQEARAARDAATAQVIAAKRVLATNQQLLRELTGEGFEMLSTLGEDMPLRTPEPENEDQWVARAMEGNLDLLSSRIAFDLATHDLGTQRTNRWPTLTLGAGYTNSNTYLSDDFNDADNSWRKYASIGISVPIFSGGAVSSQIRQAVYNQRAARERVERVTRETDRATRDFFLSVQSSISQVQANRQALESSRLALEATRAGFEVGTRTNIDVLTSQRTLQTVEAAYLQSRYTYIQNLISLKLAAGTLNPADLQEINGWLVQ
jgi:outer membrane protein